MLLAAGLSGLQMIFLGLSILVIAFLLRRGHIRGRRSKSRDVGAELRREMQRADAGAAAHIHKLEVRLHDYGREVEARMQTRIAQLDQLLIEADREIEKLRSLLESGDTGTSRKPAASHDSAGKTSANRTAVPSSEEPPPLSVRQVRMIERLQQAGYDVDEIAQLVGRPVRLVRGAVEQEQRQGHSDAA